MDINMDKVSISVNTCMLFCIEYRFLAILVCNFTCTYDFCQYLYVFLHIPMFFCQYLYVILHTPTISVNTCMLFYIYQLLLLVLVCYFTYTNYFRQCLYAILHIPTISVNTCMLFYIYL